MSVFFLDNEIVHFEVLGRGKPLLFLHGWVGSWRYWMPAMQAASITYRTFALDLWGFGDTAKSPQHYALEKQIELIHFFIREAGVKKIAIIGHGLGAAVGACFAMRNPGSVDRMIVIGLSPESGVINPNLQAATPLELAEWLLTRSVDGDTSRLEAPKTDGRAIQISLSDLNNLGLDVVIQKLKTPCLFVYGQNDPALPAPSFQETGAGLPEHFHQIVFDQSGHFPMLDEPAKFNRLLVDFLSIPSGVSPRQLQLKDEWKRRVR